MGDYRGGIEIVRFRDWSVMGKQYRIYIPDEERGDPPFNPQKCCIQVKSAGPVNWTSDYRQCAKLGIIQRGEYYLCNLHSRWISELDFFSISQDSEIENS